MYLFPAYSIPLSLLFFDSVRPLAVTQLIRYACAHLHRRGQLILWMLNIAIENSRVRSSISFLSLLLSFWNFIVSLWLFFHINELPALKQACSAVSSEHIQQNYIYSNIFHASFVRLLYGDALIFKLLLLSYLFWFVEISRIEEFVWTSGPFL